MRTFVAILTALAFQFSAGCDRSSPKSEGGAPPPPDSGAAQEQQAAGNGHDHGAPVQKDEHPQKDPGHAGQVIGLGTAGIGGLTVRASRDKGEIKAGGDAPIDVWITTADGTPAKVVVVRFWIGTEVAKGSIKAKAEIENPKQPHHWHTHVEVPDPLPTGSGLWVEVETPQGNKLVGSFDLKR